MRVPDEPHPFDRLDLTGLIPAGYRRYLPAITEALDGFLARLPRERLLRIVARQRALRPPATAEDRLLAILRECPTLHKLGQVVARDRRLGPELRARLQRLESLAPEMPAAAVSAQLRHELGALGKTPGTHLQVASAPLAEGSVAVVVPFDWSDGERTIPGVFKLLRPGVEEQLEQELAIWSDLGELLDAACQRLDLPPIDYRETFETVTRLLLHEIDFESEQRNLAEAGRVYGRRPEIEVPELLPLSTPRLTAMTRVDGRKVTDLPRAPASQRRRLARRIAEALVAEPIFSERSAPLFHADPHAGNLLAAGDGRLGVIDWSLVGRLGKPARLRLAQLVLAAARLDASRVARSLAGLSEKAPDDRELRRAVGRSLRGLRRGRLLGSSWILSLLDEAMLSGAVRYPPDLVLFRKALHTIGGVLADVSLGFWLERALVSAALAELARELPRRLASSPFSREFATHLSNADLLSLMVSGPATIMNFWRGTLGDLLRGDASS